MKIRTHTASPALRRMAASCWLTMLLLASGCGPMFRGGVYRQRSLAFRVGPLAEAWHRIQVRGGQLVFRHSQGGTIAAHATCKELDDVPLDVLTNHLLFGLEDRVEQSRERFVLDGRAALRTRVDGKVDGVPVALWLVVMRKNACVYDLQLIAGAAQIAARRPDFERFVTGFATLDRRSSKSESLP